MRALSIMQPWAYAITNGTKRIENRTWYTAFRGPFLIHAGKRYQIGAEIAIHGDSPEVDVAGMLTAPRGAIVGSASVVDCVRVDNVAADQRVWAGGPWCFILSDVRACDPIPYIGALGFFEVDVSRGLESPVSAASNQTPQNAATIVPRRLPICRRCQTPVTVSTSFFCFRGGAPPSVTRHAECACRIADHAGIIGAPGPLLTASELASLRAEISWVQASAQNEATTCSICGRPSVALCDYVVAGGTCDVGLCGRHRLKIGPDRDVCPDHRRAVTGEQLLPFMFDGTSTEVLHHGP
jgi:hypothetical protein